MNRSSQIIRTSIVGIVANVLLAGFKAAIGILSGSVAIVMDAINNLSDALSSVITIVGTKLSPCRETILHIFRFWFTSEPTVMNDLGNHESSLEFRD